MRVQNYMTTDVFTLRADKKLLIAEEIMKWAKVRHIPVLGSDNKLVGMISQRDLLEASLSSWENRDGIANRQHLQQITIGDVMQTDVRAIDPEAPVQAAARLMCKGKYGCLPVVDSHNRLVGILSALDLLGILEHIDLDCALERQQG